jgi:CcmD family protein
MRLSKLPRRLALAAAATLAAVAPVAAQAVSAPAAGLSGQSLRPYQFVFLAYALAWLLVMGWVVAVARRLARLERRLGK